MDEQKELTEQEMEQRAKEQADAVNAAEQAKAEKKAEAERKAAEKAAKKAEKDAEKAEKSAEKVFRFKGRPMLWVHQCGVWFDEKGNYKTSDPDVAAVLVTLDGVSEVD